MRISLGLWVSQRVTVTLSCVVGYSYPLCVYITGVERKRTHIAHIERYRSAVWPLCEVSLSM